MMARRGNTASAGSLLTVAWMMSESSVELRMLVTRLTLPAWSAWDTDLARLSGSAQGTGFSLLPVDSSDCKTDICSSMDFFTSSPLFSGSPAGTDFTEVFLFLLDLPIIAGQVSSGYF